MSEEQLRVAHERLKEIRDRKDLTLKPNRFLRTKIVDPFGNERDFAFRYYQVQAILHFICMNRFLLGDDTGLGKTAITIGALTYLWARDDKMKALILTTKSAAPQWVGEFNKFTMGIETFLLKGTKKQRAKIYRKFLAHDGPAALVSGYRSVVNDYFNTLEDIDLKTWKDFAFVCDEATAFKTPTTSVHKACKALAQQACRVWALTATMIKNNLMEGFGIYQIVAPGLFPAKSVFMREYCQVRYIRRGYRKFPEIVGYSPKNISDFREKIDPYFLGRAKFDVCDELPALSSKVIKFKMNRAQKAKYDEALDGLLTLGDKSGEERVIEVDKLTSIMRCQQIVNHPSLIDCEGDSEKLDQLIDIINEGDLAGEKVIIFTRFKEMVNIAMPILENTLTPCVPGSKEPICVRVTGSDSADAREEAKRLFMDPNSNTRVIWITMAGADAINLQIAKAVIFYDTPWSAGDYLQILGRMIRVGSIQDNVFALHMVAEQSIDERVMAVLKKKMKLVEAILGKRIKGSSEENESIEIVKELDELFDALKQDAKGKT